MRFYANATGRDWSFVLGNGTREWQGWPLDLSISSYGWVTRTPSKDGTKAWADTDIEIGPFRFAWQFSFGPHGLSVSTNYELRRKYPR